ncbi:fungal-specific transcription factor domain-containing protein, partial [Bisporella sp. PMI_857]
WPDYVKSLPQQITPSDIECLVAKDALSLPNNKFRNALIYRYLKDVHPGLPIAKLHDLLNPPPGWTLSSTLNVMEDDSGASGKISLLLFLTIMLAGATVIKVGHIMSAGYSTRKDTVKSFFQNAKVSPLLFRCETDHLTIVQSLFLMTYWNEVSDDQKDAWYGMEVAISMACRFNLHKDPSNFGLEPSKEKLRKRIWWSCFMRYHFITQHMSQCSGLRFGDIDVPLLTVKDVDINPI